MGCLPSFSTGDSDFAGPSKGYFWEKSWDDKDDMMMWILPSGKRLQQTGKDPPFFMGKSTISMAIFNSKLLVYQRVDQQYPIC